MKPHCNEHSTYSGECLACYAMAEGTPYYKLVNKRTGEVVAGDWGDDGKKSLQETLDFHTQNVDSESNMYLIEKSSW